MVKKLKGPTNKVLKRIFFLEQKDYGGGEKNSTLALESQDN